MMVSPLKEPKKKEVRDFCDEKHIEDERDLCEKARTIGRSVASMNIKSNHFDLTAAYDLWMNAFLSSSYYENEFLTNLRKISGCQDIERDGTFLNCGQEQIVKVGQLMEDFTDSVYDGIEEGFNESVHYKIHKARTAPISVLEFEELLESRDPRILRALAERENLDRYPKELTDIAKLYSPIFEKK